MAKKKKTPATPVASKETEKKICQTAPQSSQKGTPCCCEQPSAQTSPVLPKS